jgi:DNA-directed RNA polymerase specialized sigma24 family protein
LCQDWHRADDLAQAAAIKAYTHWVKAARADNTDAYVNAILVREFLHERRTAWARLVSLMEAPDKAARPA